MREFQSMFTGNIATIVSSARKNGGVSKLTDFLKQSNDVQADLHPNLKDLHDEQSNVASLSLLS